MSKASFWISVVSVPVLLASAGCSLAPRPFAAARRGLPPERLMAMAKTFERQGHYSQAKSAYLQILASQPNYPEARESLDTLIANEGNPDRLKHGKSVGQHQEMIAKAKTTAASEARALAAREVESSPKVAVSEAASRVERARRASIERAKALDAEQYEDSDSTPVIASRDVRRPVEREAAYARREIQSREYETEVTRAAAPEFREPLNAFDEPRESGTSLTSASTAQTSRRSNERAAASREVLAAVDASYPAIADATSAVQTEDAATEDHGIDISDASTAGSIAAETSSNGLTPDISERDELPAKSEMPDLRTAPVVTSTESADSSSSPGETDGDESIQFEKPIIREPRVDDASLKHFFGPFHAGMVADLKANRSQFQAKLAVLASDQDADGDVRSRAVFLLGSIGPAALDVVPVLRREMHYDVDQYLRIDLCEAILKIQPEDEDAIKTLVDSLKDSDENLSWIAAFALRNAVSPRTTFIIDSLQECLATEDLKLRRMIFLTLAEFGPAAEKAIPELEAALESPDAATREVAKASLACIAPGRKTTMTIQKTNHLNELTANK